MPSISIYGPTPVIGLDSKYHYVYRITNLIENKHYYGSRTSKINPFDDLGTKYFSSAYTHFWMRKDQRNNPQNYKYKILKTFTNRHDAIIFECIIHKKVDAANSEKFYNAINQFDNKRYVSGTVLCKDKQDNCYMVQVSDPRYISGELVPFWTGKAIVKDSNGRRFSVNVDDPRYLSGELIKSGNTSNFKYWKVTPWGIFATSKGFDFEIKLDVLSCWCKNSETTRMVNRTYKKYKKIQETFGVECIGKTFKELGFYNLTDEEYKQTLNTAKTS